MSRRTAATIRRPRPHVFEHDTDNPDTCARCHLIRANDVHVSREPESVQAARDRDNAILGEKDPD